MKMQLNAKTQESSELVNFANIKNCPCHVFILSPQIKEDYINNNVDKSLYG